MAALAVFLVSLVLVSACHARLGYIVNGKNAKEGAYPWQASIQQRGSHICGASIISRNWLLTAAHCKEYPARMYTVVVGAYDLAERYGKPATHKVADFIQHEKWQESFVRGEGQFPNDIALIRLYTMIEYSSHVQPIDLDTQGFQPGTELIGYSECQSFWPRGMINYEKHQCVKSRASA